MVMKTRSLPYIFLSLIIIIFVLYPGPAHPYKAKIAVFNFNILNLDARGYDATVTNILINFLERASSLNILNRKELESFLSLNDLKQNDDLSNVVNIGDRLGLDMIIVGSVKKDGPVIEIACKIAKMAEKSFIYDKNIRSFGDSGLREEIRRLGIDISKVIAIDISKVKLPAPIKSILKAPVNIVPRSGSSKITLYWEDSPGSKSAGYKIFRSRSEEGPFIKVGQVTQREYVDKGLEKNAAYYYRIKVFDAKKRESDFSKTIHAETALTPNPPIILNTESHVKSIKIIWSPNPIKSTDSSKIMGYKLYKAKTEMGPYREVSNLLGKDLGLGIDTALDKLFKVTYLDKDLADGENYYYKVSAYNERNLESDFSNPMVGKCLPVVQGVLAEGDMIRQIKLSWNAADSDYVQGYFIYRSKSPDVGFIKIKKIIGREINSFINNKGLEDEETYYYRVSLFEDNEKEGSMSDVVSALTKGPPPIPKGIRAKGGMAKKVRLSWHVSPEEEVKGYSLYRSIAREGEYVPIKKINNPKKNEYFDKGAYNKPLTDNTTYYYRLTSYNKVAVESKTTETVSASTKPLPARPSGFGGESLHARQIPLFWQPNPEEDVIKYYIFRSSTQDEEFSEVACVEKKSSYTDKGLKDGWEYRYKIRAEDKDCLISNFSDTLTLRTKPKPRSPDGLNVAFKDGNMILTWSANTEPDIISYNVLEKSFFGLTKIGTVKEPRFIKSGPKPGKSRDYAVTAIDRDDLESEPSQLITVFGK